MPTIMLILGKNEADLESTKIVTKRGTTSMLLGCFFIYEMWKGVTAIWVPEISLTSRTFRQHLLMNSLDFRIIIVEQSVCCLVYCTFKI